MFERYTEKARRAIFHARYACSTLGGASIGCEHLLLGLLRESPGLARQYLKVDSSELTMCLTSSPAAAKKVATSVDLPLDDASRRVLKHAEEEADGMGHKFIGTEHLLLGIMREERGPATEALRAMGAPTVAEVRKAVSVSAIEGEAVAGGGSRGYGSSPSMRVVVEESGRELLASLPFQVAVPRMGEALVLMVAGEDSGRYRVVDVRWEFHGSPHGGAPLLSAVEIRVRREGS